MTIAEIKLFIESPLTRGVLSLYERERGGTLLWLNPLTAVKEFN